jgi:diguanylate cyclase (GGDEF)-like protein/PAS domain S-box-containing protein
LPALAQTPIRVLLLEDVAATTQIVKTYLNALSPDSFFDPVVTLGAALERLAGGSYDLVLADLNVPDSSGLETLDRLVAATDCLIVVLTVEDSPEVHDKAIARGAYDFLHKSQLNRATLGQVLRLAAIQANTFRSLRESEARFRSLTELSSDFYWETDAFHKIAQVSHGARHTAVNTTSDLLGNARWDLPSTSPAPEGWARHRACMDAHEPFFGFAFSRLDAQGKERHLVINGEPIFEANGTFTGYRGVGHDVTKRRESEDALRSAVSLLTATLESTADGILVVAADHSIARFNQRFVDMWRIPASIIEERDDNRVLSFVTDQVADPASFIARVEDLYAHPEVESFDTIEFRDGRTFERYSCAQLVAGRPIGRVWSFRDITDRRRAEKQIHVLAYQDPLTELPNRALFRDRMKQATARADRAGTTVALLFLDLDNFKMINDSLGHAAGDDLLKQIAARMRLCVRDTDTISRQGGDEFLVMLTDLAGSEMVTPIVDKLMAQLQAPFEIDGTELTTSVSIGIASYPNDGEDFDALLKKSDTAMYRAKESGRNTYRFFDEHMNVEAIEHLNIRNGLRLALDRAELVLHYQPQIDLRTGRVVGAEALVRWLHPRQGLVFPSRFIPVAEDNGLIVPIGEWVLGQACRQAVRWHEAGLTGLIMAVNFSAVQFRRSKVEQTVMRALTASGLDPSLLELELTESILIHDTENTLAAVKRLKALGVKLSIDDFGTGYSSLSYLRRFDVDKLKIDQSFINDLSSDPGDAAIVRAIIQMARSLDLRTIAEGVEDRKVLGRLREFNCDEAQGHYFAPAMPAEEFAEYLLRGAGALVHGRKDGGYAA